MSQLALPLKLQDHAVFETYWGSGNEAVLAFIEDLCRTAQGPGCWLWGPQATGKSHLLQAVCNRIGGSAAFLPMADLLPAGAGVLEGMASRSFLCLDDLQRVAGKADWEGALFRLFNEAMERYHVIIAVASGSARETGFELADLESRFTQLPSFQLSPLDDADLQSALKLRARHRGLELPNETARYLLNRERRDMASLYALLDHLDSEALIAQRRLTVPFVKSVLDA